MAEISFSICPPLECAAGDKVFFYLKDPAMLKSNDGLSEPIYYLLEATITNVVVQNCKMSYYTFEYDETLLSDYLQLNGLEFTKNAIDKVCCHDCNTQFIKEVIARNGLL